MRRDPKYDWLEGPTPAPVKLTPEDEMVMCVNCQGTGKMAGARPPGMKKGNCPYCWGAGRVTIIEDQRRR